MPERDDSYRTLFFCNGVPVRARPSFRLMLLAAWSAVTILTIRRRPERGFAGNLLVGTVSFVALLTADIGHVLGHTVSARLGGAPMDEIRLAADMPRTIYFDDGVPPRAHCLRAIGGPIFSAAGLVLGLAWRAMSAPGSVAREVAEMFTLGHGFIFAGSLMPLPIVDGGVLLKWSLAARGATPEEAEQRVRQLNVGLGATLLGSGIVLLLLGRKLFGSLVAAAGAIGGAAGLRLIR